MSKHVALLIDGDNISATHAAALFEVAATLGTRVVSRVYGNSSGIAGWHAVTGLRLMHSGTGKNASDILLTLDAMQFALTRDIDTFLIASSDGDYGHLMLRLRELGKTAIGVGRPKTPDSYRSTCSRFIALEDEPQQPDAKQPTSLDAQILAAIAFDGDPKNGMRLSLLGQHMYQKHGVGVDDIPDATWRDYLSSRPHLYDLDPRGPNARVRPCRTFHP